MAYIASRRRKATTHRTTATLIPAAAAKVFLPVRGLVSYFRGESYTHHFKTPLVEISVGSGELQPIMCAVIPFLTSACGYSCTRSAASTSSYLCIPWLLLQQPRECQVLLQQMKATAQSMPQTTRNTVVMQVTISTPRIPHPSSAGML